MPDHPTDAGKREKIDEILRQAQNDKPGPARLPVRESIAIDIFAMSDALDFDQFPLAKHVVHDPIVAQPDPIAVFRAGKFFRAMGKGIRAEPADRFYHPLHDIGR